MVKINKPNLSFRGKLSPLNKSRVKYLVQHHMAHKSWGLHDVHNFHKNSNGWAGIGYNYWIDFNGNIYEGRGLNVGAHVAGFNSVSVGVGYQGDFTSQQMTSAQLRAGKQLNNWLMSQFGIGKSAIVGHRDLASTSCPGKNFRMAELKGGSASSWTKVNGSWTGQTLGNGEYGSPVEQLQNLLYNAYPRYLEKSDVDSYFGSVTENAVKSFQSDHSLTIDGLAGRATYNKLKDVLTVSEYNKLDNRLKKLESQIKNKANEPKNGGPSSTHKDNWEWAKQFGLLNGKDPYHPVTREQFATMMNSYDSKRFNVGEEVSSTHEQSWDWLVNEGITNGGKPHMYLTREQFATLLYKYHDKFVHQDEE